MNLPPCSATCAKPKGHFYIFILFNLSAKRTQLTMPSLKKGASVAILSPPHSLLLAWFSLHWLLLCPHLMVLRVFRLDYGPPIASHSFPCGHVIDCMESKAIFWQMMLTRLSPLFTPNVNSPVLPDVSTYMSYSTSDLTHTNGNS